MRKVLRFLCRAHIVLVLLPGCLTVPVVHAKTGPVPYITNISTSMDPGFPGYPYLASAQWRMMAGTGDLDVRIGSAGRIVFALCGKFALAYGSVCMGMTKGNVELQLAVTPEMTWRDASDLITKKMGSGGPVMLYGQAAFYSPDLCVGVGFIPAVDSIYIHSTPVWFPGTICTLAPPENFTCSQELSSPSVDFGTVASKNIPYTKGSVILTSTCNAIGTVTITPGWGGGPIPMTTASGAGGIAARPYLDFVPVERGATFKSKIGSMQQKLEFRLEKTGIKMDSPGYGTYTASAVFVFSYI
ncbi:hypothetical protein WKH24_11085 [Pantoea agglomerans]|uniref:hypothetical protein n=1 Tax=Enterobacter agglomerans TaxID=549 RepID=UPI003C7BAE6A